MEDSDGDVRIIRRFFRRKFGFEKSKREGFRNNNELLQWNHEYDDDNLLRALNVLAKYGDKVLQFSSADALLSETQKGGTIGNDQ